MQRVDDHPRLLPNLATFSQGSRRVSVIVVSSRLSLRRRLWTAATWPVGIAFTSWNYMWRTTPMHHSEAIGSSADLPPPLPQGFDDDEVQSVERRSALPPALPRPYP